MDESLEKERRANSLVLVTGATGYVASHCVRQLLEQGYRVRGTVRSTDPRRVGSLLGLPHADDRLELVVADLLREDDWPRAMTGVRFVMHVASPWPIVADESCVRTAVQGTLNVLRAAAQVADVKKVVLTSSCAAINDGHPNSERVFDETVWTRLDASDVDFYARSKTLAEQAAWQLHASLPDGSNKFALCVLNPTFVVGPVLSSQSHGSATIVSKMLFYRKMMAAPQASLGFVDVRDVATAHVRAMERSSTDNERILVTAESHWMYELVRWVRRKYSKQGYFITRVISPNWLTRFYIAIGLDRDSTAIKHRIGKCPLRFDNSKSIRLLDMKYRDIESSVLDMIESMFAHDMLTKTRARRKYEQSQIVISQNNGTVTTQQ